MTITKYVHSCLLVETPERVALFDPGSMSVGELDLANIPRLDDIIITHIHPDHYDKDFIKQAIAKFPVLKITAPQEVIDDLAKDDIQASSEASDGIELFDAPHEPVEPVFPLPQQIGVHYLNVFSDPGDSHSFSETREILALPITAPWGSSIKAVNLGLELKPKHIIPIHDWHWSEQARTGTYDMYAKIFDEHGIKFHKPETGQPINIDTSK